MQKVNGMVGFSRTLHDFCSRHFQLLFRRRTLAPFRTAHKAHQSVPTTVGQLIAYVRLVDLMSASMPPILW